jgi:Sulfotransferase family
MRKSVFVHLPKTAGTSFHNALRESLGQGGVSPSFIATRMTPAEAAKLDRFTVISGHISFDDVKRYFPDRVILTIIRDPVDRCLSWYYFARKPTTRAFSPDFAAAKQHGIEEFFALDYRVSYRNVYNRQVRQLGGHVLDVDADVARAFENAKEVVRSAAWVGRQENLNADIERLKLEFPELAGLAIPTLNTTNERKSASDLDPALIERIRSLNKFDVDLYSYAAREVCAPAI